MKFLIFYKILILFGIVDFISGLKNANISISSWHVSLEHREKHDCSGAILDERHVITSAQCLDKDSEKKNYRIRAGSAVKNQGGTSHNIVNIHKHPSHHVNKTDWDVAVLEVDPPFTWDQNHSRIELYDHEETWGASLTGEVTSWDLGADNEHRSPDLKVEQISQTISKEECKRGQQLDKQDGHEHFVCADVAIKKACGGDFGALLVINGPNGKRLAGTGSMVSLCKSPVHANTYTEIAPNRKWIDSILHSK